MEKITMSDSASVFSALTSFTDQGMELTHDYTISKLKNSEIQVIANYYSIIFNASEKQEGLFGPLPVAYHTEYLLYVYTFTIRDKAVKDERIQRNNNKVNASLLIFFPINLENLANKTRQKITEGIKTWKAKFTEIQQITTKEIDKLNLSITYAMSRENIQLEMSESDKISVVLSKSVELLYNVNNYQEKTIKFVIAGTDDLLFSLSRKIFLTKNASIVDHFTHNDNYMEIKAGKLEFNIIKLNAQKPQIQKYLSNDISGIMYFGNFSTPELMDIHSQQLEEILKNTNKNCLISFAMSQNEQSVIIEETSLPIFLQKATGRTLTLFDLANEDMNLGKAIIETMEKMVELIIRSR
jgi:hypothetical protein